MTCKHGNHSMHCGWCEDQARITELESEVKALRQQIQDNALQQLASEGQWIELTGSLRADAERYRKLRRMLYVGPVDIGEACIEMRVTGSCPDYGAFDIGIDAARKG